MTDYELMTDDEVASIEAAIKACRAIKHRLSWNGKYDEAIVYAKADTADDVLFDFLNSANHFADVHVPMLARSEA